MGRPCGGSFRDGAMGTDAWGPLPTLEQGWGMAALHLTLLLYAARRQDQVIDGHSPHAAGHPLNQHLQGSTMPATSTWGFA